MNAKLNIENITPKRAAELLQTLFEGQRHLREAYVKRLAESIRSGAWRLSPDCLVLVKGRLANGQHRLSAVIQAGKSAQFIVMETNDDDLYKIMDCGLKRTVGDIFIGVPNANQIAAVAMLVVRYDKQQLTLSGGGPQTPPRDQIVDYIEANKETLCEEIKLIQPFYKKHPILRLSVAMAGFHLARRVNKEKALEFMEKMFTGSSKGDASWDMREKAIRDATSRAKLSGPYLFAVLIKSMRSYFNGTRLGNLKMHDKEEFPRF